jgi:hypothetical protein
LLSRSVIHRGNRATAGIYIYMFLLFCLLAAFDAASAQAAKAIARIRAASGSGLTVSGSVTFEQSSPLGDMTVRAPQRTFDI